jgi:hypothetical protein
MPNIPQSLKRLKMFLFVSSFRLNDFKTMRLFPFRSSGNLSLSGIPVRKSALSGIREQEIFRDVMCIMRGLSPDECAEGECIIALRRSSIPSGLAVSCACHRSSLPAGVVAAVPIGLRWSLVLT